ncbi:hypothetical protein B0H14DRAFT_2560762 [Mycena olivaceomarginata]|nr:hypothetical protein B0H14DRAFT_2620014 [Mycena olivaceomarginata]KAJ7891713.1 hypothetical protein B0H14DRAFT_2560762 [Mycena olivaceomarginata]
MPRNISSIGPSPAPPAARRAVNVHDMLERTITMNHSRTIVAYEPSPAPTSSATHPLAARYLCGHPRSSQYIPGMDAASKRGSDTSRAYAAPGMPPQVPVSKFPVQSMTSIRACNDPGELPGAANDGRKPVGHRNTYTACRRYSNT